MTREEVDDLLREVGRLVGGEVAADIWAALRLAEEKHAGQRRPGGEPQIDHVARVGCAAAEYAMAHGFEPERFRTLVVSAVLHDVLEDTPTTDEELAAQFGAEVARIVRALSHAQEEEPDAAYLARVAFAGEAAVLVKRFDRLDNLATLAATPKDFRDRKIAEVTASLSIWKQMDRVGWWQIRRALEGARVGAAAAKSVLWLSQHRPLGVQLERLATKFGSDVRVKVDTNTFTNAEELVGRFSYGAYDDWVVVAPYSVVGRMCELCEELGLPKPLMARMDLLPSARRAEADLVYRGRLYKFASFRRVRRLVLEFGEEF